MSNCMDKRCDFDLLTMLLRMYALYECSVSCCVCCATRRATQIPALTAMLVACSELAHTIVLLCVDNLHCCTTYHCFNCHACRLQELS
jgi:hypothetical protein